MFFHIVSSYSASCCVLSDLIIMFGKTTFETILIFFVFVLFGNPCAEIGGACAEIGWACVEIGSACAEIGGACAEM